MSSSSSSAPPAHDDIIDEILKTEADKPDFDLSRFVAQIDVLVAHYEAQLRKKKPIREKLGELPSATDASNFADQVSTNVKSIASEIKGYSGNAHETSIRVLNTIGSVHWVAVGFLMVGASLKIVDTIENNKEECLRLFKSMINLSKVILQLLDLPSLQKELHGKLHDSIQLIVKGAILCCSQKKMKGFKRIWNASKDNRELQQLNKDMKDTCEMLNLQISASTFKGVQSIGNTLTSLVSPPPRIPTLNHDAVGIEEKIKEVIQELDWESDSATTAVVLYGIGGSGKTTLADAVYASLNEKLNGWKHCKVTLIQSLEIYPNIEKIQSSILDDLTTTKHDIKNYQSGQQSLKEIIEKESMFLYLDNALYLEPIEKLLPKDFTRAKKFRLLLTARETNVSGTIKYCGIETCKLYDIGSLSFAGALEVLCRRIERKKEKEIILQERPLVREIAEKCSCCPLYLEVIGAYIQQRENKVEAYEQVLHSLKSGEDFGGSKKYNFDESRVLFSYYELKSSTQEAFLDICSFFSWRPWKWDWEGIACIVGEEEMECLQEAALIKREGKEIKIHDLILAAGRKRSKQNRIKNVEDFSLTLKDKELASQVKGVWMKNLRRPLFISAEELDAMSQSLRIFYMGYGTVNLTIVKGKCSKQFDQLRCLSVEGGMRSSPINIFKLNHLRYLSIQKPKEDVILSPSMNLLHLKVLELNGCRIHGTAQIARLHSLKQLKLLFCNTDGISECLPNLHNLQILKLSHCEDVEELPDSLVRLRSLEKLDLSCCRNLKQLPAGFGELTSLTELDLSYCARLQELPRDLEKLNSLQSLSISGCKSLLCLPRSLGRLTSALGSRIEFDFCSGLSELPEDICKDTLVTSISLVGCTNLKRLPSRFGELACLQNLSLDGCESLEELCNDFHCLEGLRQLSLSKCKGLSNLPQNFGKLSSLETLHLSQCVKLKELSSDFHCLVALKWLSLSRCDSLCNLPDRFGELSCLKKLDLSTCSNLTKLPDRFGELSCLKTLDLSTCSNLTKLPDRFGELSCLEWLHISRCSNLTKLPDRFGELSCLKTLDLSRCSNLTKLSDDFHLLRSLLRLDLTECESLGAEWMDSVLNMRSLWRLDIVGSERLIERWMETKSQKERNLVVVTDSAQGTRALLLEVVLSKAFDEEGLLVDAHGDPFHSSSLPPQTPLILIIDSNYSSWRWGAFAENLQQLHRNSKELQIIYVGRCFKSLTSELPGIRILAYTPDNSRTSSFYYKSSATFDTSSTAVFRSTDQLEENNLKLLLAWEDVSSYMLDRMAFLANTPGESNLELLKGLLVTEETDYLLLSEDRQVKVAALQGKLILLLFTHLDMTTMVRTSVVKEMYVKMQENGFTSNLVEVVWVPRIQYEETWEEFDREAANALWPVVPNPWLIEERIRSFIRWQRMPCVCVVDEKGRVSNKDAMPMIERWGVEAYPFSEAREEELTKAEWEAFKLNSSSSLQFVFPNLDSLSKKAKEAMDRGAMTLFCVGSPKKMTKLSRRLNAALTTLGTEFLVVYVAPNLIHRVSSDDYDMVCEKLKENESEMCRIAIPPHSVRYRFWRRVEYLQKELKSGMGTDDRIVKVRRMVLGLASAVYDIHWGNKKEANIVVVDESGEFVSGRGMEVVKEMCDGEDESKVKLADEIKKRGIEKSMESRWRDGLIHPKHHPKHPLLKLWGFEGIGCSLCNTKLWTGYQCNVCEKYVICEKCGRGEVRDDI